MKTQDIRNMGQAFLQVLENQKAAIAKKLAKASASSEKGKAAVTLPKAPFEIPEDVPVDERDMFMAKAAAAHKAGKTHFTMPGGKKHPVTMKKDTAQAVNSSTNEAVDLNKDNADAAVKHDCATHVEHAQWGKGTPISEQHTIVETAPGEGYVTHYDVMFEHGIEKNVAVDDLNILAEMSHGHSRKKKNEMSSKEKMKRGLYNSLDHPAHSRVKEKMHGKKGEDEVEMNPTKKKQKKDQEMNGDMANESLVRAVYKRIIEKRDAHYKSATDPETMDDKFKGAGAKKSKSDLETGAKVDDTVEKGHDDASKAGRVTKKSPARRGDQQTGDTNIINKPMDVTKS